MKPQAGWFREKGIKKRRIRFFSIAMNASELQSNKRESPQNQYMEKTLASITTQKADPKLSLVPTKVYNLAEELVVRQRARKGTLYGAKKGEENCVTLPLHVLKKMYKEQTGKKFPSETFVNGGKLLERYEQKGGTITILAPGKLISEGNLKPGNLILAVERAKSAGELKMHYDAGDYAIWQDKDGKCNIETSQDEAKDKLKDKTGTLFLVKHYLTFADDTPRKETVLHASSKDGKVEEVYLPIAFAKTERLCIVVDLEVAYPELASKGRKKENKNEFAASSP
jgi:hypothetical protein